MVSWKQVVERSDIIGGDLETVEDGVVYRGPISEIVVEDGVVYFKSPWTAVMTENGWERNPIDVCSVREDVCTPQEIGGGRIVFVMPFLGRGTIFPKGDSKLDPSKVRGLELS